MASMNTRLNIEKLNRNIVQKHGGMLKGIVKCDFFRLVMMILKVGSKMVGGQATEEEDKNNGLLGKRAGKDSQRKVGTDFVEGVKGHASLSQLWG
ncbi:hypothetical protein Tco_1237856 [Tanacetum coccineum]